MMNVSTPRRFPSKKFSPKRQIGTKSNKIDVSDPFRVKRTENFICPSCFNKNKNCFYCIKMEKNTEDTDKTVFILMKGDEKNTEELKNIWNELNEVSVKKYCEKRRQLNDDKAFKLVSLNKTLIGDLQFPNNYFDYIQTINQLSRNMIDIFDKQVGYDIYLSAVDEFKKFIDIDKKKNTKSISSKINQPIIKMGSELTGTMKKTDYKVSEYKGYKYIEYISSEKAPKFYDMGLLKSLFELLNTGYSIISQVIIPDGRWIKGYNFYSRYCDISITSTARGKMLFNEAQKSACVREIKEELGLDIEKSRFNKYSQWSKKATLFTLDI